ncbi:phosphodiesterase [Rosistilla ulvae]|uniref:Phosphodiesterase n=1 Tax=Rosistilla ulvae TaxID=1930277 RepID=A0A517M480_9BACT|nr:metallophosphoesterase family protein [Rosistilla ulvae]QDS89682.1 phosphodiesterase [Rosistilla ulvae]
MPRQAIVSDIHGNLVALQAVLADIAEQNVDSIACLGDVVGYGPQPCECLDVVAGFEFTILGNHDLSALFDPEGFNAAAEQAIFWTRRQLENGTDKEASRRRLDLLCNLPRTYRRGGMLYVHGSARGPTTEYVFPEDTYNPRKMEKIFSMVPEVCFQGHTHVPGVFTHENQFVRPDETGHVYELSGKKAMVNVGSVGQPRDGDPRSCYVIVEDHRLEFRRVEYDIEKTVRMIEAEADLDNFLGYRLREGR